MKESKSTLGLPVIWMNDPSVDKLEARQSEDATGNATGGLLTG